MLVGVVVTAATASALIAVKKFPDVDYNSYYGTAVESMVGMGVMTGYENGNFGPNDVVTRAQLATVLNRYNEEVGYMKILICDGVDRDAVANQHIYDKLCPSVLQ
ncbi:S-layer homology domain-containing protein [Candidatus Peregrinibacteria bacterium]|nr:S-layer homology domain-containing protein [Candidatus Peregrinibacteria bacterium]